MQKITLTAIATAALFALSGAAATAAAAQDSTPICSKTVTDNCMQREGHAATAHRAPAKHHGAKHRTGTKHRIAATHHRKAPHRKMAAAAPKAPAPKK